MKNLKNFNAMELTLKHAYLMQEIEQLPPGTKTIAAKKKEAKALERELKNRLRYLLVNNAVPIYITAPKEVL